MSITLTGTAGIAATTELELDLYAGTIETSTAWLDGNAGGSYPGSLTGFLASNDDGNAEAGLKLLTGTILVPASGTLTLSGDATKIVSLIVSGTGEAASAVAVALAAGVATLTLVGTAVLPLSFWAIVA